MLFVVLAMVLVAGLGPSAGGERETVGTAAFLKRHWHQPLAPQGPAPAHFSPLERSLSAESCGTCHPAQLADWKTSLHARSMGPGVAGQLIDMLRSDPDSARLCLTCHAPLAEQTPGAQGFDAALQTKGLVCAACHVRGQERFGPPRRDGSVASPVPRETLPHNGVTRTPAFVAADFCSICHQFEAGDPRCRDDRAGAGGPFDGRVSGDGIPRSAGRGGVAGRVATAAAARDAASPPSTIV